MNKILKKKHYTEKNAVLQKLKLSLKWISLFVGMMTSAMLLGPLFLSHPQQAQRLKIFLQQYRVVFWMLHAGFIVSTFWWWPAYIRARGESQQWPQAMIKQASNCKWAVMLVLASLCILFFTS